MFPPADAARFKMSSAIVWLFRIVTVLALGFLVLAFGALVKDRSLGAIGLVLASVLICGAIAAYCWDAQARALSQFAVDETGIWRLPPKGAPLFIAWPDVSAVRADDTMQRLIVSDRSAGQTIWLEYQLNDFSTLRDFVLRHAPSATRAGSANSVFHRTWINKAIMLVFSAPLWAMAVLAFSRGQIGTAAVFLAFGLLGLVVIVRDPLRLSIGTDGFVISYPGWRRDIPFNEIASVALDEESSRGNVWAVVVVTLKHDKPVKLYRFREGSLALLQALQSAVGSASPDAAN
jgi:hypothetical protein